MDFQRNRIAAGLVEQVLEGADPKQFMLDRVGAVYTSRVLDVLCKQWGTESVLTRRVYYGTMAAKTRLVDYVAFRASYNFTGRFSIYFRFVTNPKYGRGTQTSFAFGKDFDRPGEQLEREGPEELAQGFSAWMLTELHWMDKILPKLQDYDDLRDTMTLKGYEYQG